MAKVKPEVWAKAKALREAGKSFREIAKLLNIPFVTISDRAKKEGWEAGKNVQLIKDTVRVESEIRTLEPVQKEVVRDEVDKQIKMLEFFNNSSVNHCKIMMDQVEKKYKAKQEIPFIDHKTIQSTLREGKETVFGKMPETVINNSNAQQTNKEKKVIFEVIGGTTRST
jgi:hypothetical protein